jgi:DNA-binding transcriptional regulator LsrR (DeoR family)
MIDLKKKQEVLLMYLMEGKSQREIARRIGIDRKTVSKYIKEYENKKVELEKQGTNQHNGEFIQSIVESPKYKVGNRKKRVLTKEIEERIKELLEENEEKKLK